MKKNRAKEEKFPGSAEHPLRKREPENILVFLVLAVILLAANLFSGYRQSLPKNIAANTAEQPETYIWLTGNPGQPDGLYVFTAEQQQDFFADTGLLQPAISGESQNKPVAALDLSGQSPRTVKLPAAVANVFLQPIPINRADKDILTSLPGIGPILAERIIQRREHYGPYRSKAELLQVAGIGPKKFAGLADRITLD